MISYLFKKRTKISLGKIIELNKKAAQTVETLIPYGQPQNMIIRWFSENYLGSYKTKSGSTQIVKNTYKSSFFEGAAPETWINYSHVFCSRSSHHFRSFDSMFFRTLKYDVKNIVHGGRSIFRLWTWKWNDEIYSSSA